MQVSSKGVKIQKQKQFMEILHFITLAGTGAENK
jgi:hypothetical protein